jgi:hypothetical protein
MGMARKSGAWLQSFSRSFVEASGATLRGFQGKSHFAIVHPLSRMIVRARVAEAFELKISVIHATQEMA